MSNHSPYNITFLYGFMDPDGGASFSLNADMDRKLILTKERCFERANADNTMLRLKDDVIKPKRLADRAYLHYIVDCWLDNEPITLEPSEVP